MSEKLTDDSPMLFGKYKGERMENVPASYLFFLWTNGKEKDNVCPVANYIRENLGVLEHEYPNGIWR